MATSGWIKVYRKIMDDPLYFEEKFTRMQAWLDLLLLANFEDSEIHIRGNRVVVKRGQVSWSKDRLADRWRWSKGKVLRFLTELQNSGKIELQNSKLIGLISIVKYEKYQSIELQKEPQIKPQIELPNKNIKNNISLKNAREEFFQSLEDCYNTLSGNQIWAQTITMNTCGSGYPEFTIEDFHVYLRKFFAKLANEGETEKAPKDAMSHFARWLKIELKHDTNSRNNSTSKADANAYAFQRFIEHCSDPNRGMADGDKPF